MAEDLGNYIGWGLIGTPDGIECKGGGCIQHVDLRTILDLDNRHIEIFPGTEILCLFREIRNGHVVYYYLLYRYAREIRSGRPGTFYGSVLVAVERFIDAEKAWSILYGLSNYLENFLDADKRFRGSILNIPLPEPEEIKDLSRFIRPGPAPGLKKTGACFHPLSGKEELAKSEFFQTASEILSSGIFNRVYGAESPQIIQRLRSRNTLPFIYKDTLWQNLKIEAQTLELQQLQLKYQEESERSKENADRHGKELKKTAHSLEQLRHEHAVVLKDAGHKLDLARQEISRLQKKMAHGAGRLPPTNQPSYPHHVRKTEKFVLRKRSVWIGAGIAGILLLSYAAWRQLPGSGHSLQTSYPRRDSTALIKLEPLKIISYKPDLQLQKLAFMYCEEMKNTANQYQADTVSTLLTRLKEAGMENDSSYIKLNSLFHNYGLTGLTLSELAISWYTVKKGDYSPALVLKHLKTAHPGIQFPLWFDASFLAINELQADSRLRTGTKFTILLPAGK